MKTELPQEQRDQRDDLHVSRAGRVVKRTFQFKEPLPPTRGVLCGRWSVNDKKNLLTCLKKYQSVQYNPLTIWRSVRNRPKSQVVEFMLRLRRKAAAHSESIRKKQPPILTWFQVADELSWLKDDEDLYMTVVPLLSIMTVEANSKQSKNSVLQFSKLYKYLKCLHSDVVMPELTPAESVVLLDCFQHLADTLRASDTKAQTEFMLNQYKKYFQLLYFASEGVGETRVKTSVLRQEKENEKTAKKASSAARKASARQSGAHRPLMKAELRKKEPRKRAKKKQTKEQTKDVTSEQDKGQGSQDRPDIETESQKGHEDDVRSNPADQNETFSRRVESVGESIGDDSRSSVNDGISALSDPSGISTLSETSNQNVKSTGEATSSEPTADGDMEKDPASGDEEDTEASPTDTTGYGDLDPEDPIFLTKFARMFSLGSLNPFEIPPHLINIGPKRQDDQFESENDWASPSSPTEVDESDPGGDPSNSTSSISVTTVNTNGTPSSCADGASGPVKTVNANGTPTSCATGTTGLVKTLDNDIRQSPSASGTIVSSGTLQTPSSLGSTSHSIAALGGIASLPVGDLELDEATGILRPASSVAVPAVNNNFEDKCIIDQRADITSDPVES